jgi:DNA-binding NarL/FixJ family response regulator
MVRSLLPELHVHPRTTGTEVALLVRVILWRLQAPARQIGGTRKPLVGCLPARQQAVLELIGKGRSNKEIARALNLAPETIKSYVKHIFNKLGTQTRAESVAYAAKLGLLS